MGYNTYREYDDTDIIWAKQLPAHWETNRFKIVFSYSKGKNPQTFFDDKKEGLAPYLSMEYLRNDINPTYVPVKECPLRADVGDILLLWDGSNAGEFIISKEGLVSSTMAKLTPNILLDKNFSIYLCKSIEPLLRELTIGMGVPHVSTTELNNIILPKIPLKEQQKIANYLDKQTAKIDATIVKNKELIQLLEEKRIALINQVVTKGLNPDVPMKDSGVEWIGEMPEHWDVAPLSRYVNVTKLAGFEFTEHIEYIPDGEIIALRALNIKNNKLDLNNIVKISKEVSNKLPRSKLYDGDLIFTYVGAKTGAVALIDKNNTYHLAPNIAKITNISKNQLHTKFLMYNIASHHEQEEIWFKIAKSGQEAISMEKIRTLSLVIPPIEEQKLIMDYLDKETSRLDNAIQKITENIQLLEEYKTSLIHHVVTGKIDVRGEEI